MTDITVTWAWGTHQRIDFDPALDTLDFGWLAAAHFTVAEVNGDLLISIPSNNQSYTLIGVGLGDLDMNNVTTLDTTAQAEWQTLLGVDGDPGPGDPLPPTDPDPGDEADYAAPWSADTIYLAGDRVSQDNAVYVANWWTRGDIPDDHSGAPGSGLVWTFAGYIDDTPVVPEAPDDLRALSVGETSAVLRWDAAEVDGVGTVSHYEVYRGGQLIGTTDTTRFEVTGLSAETDYAFTVVAFDEAGGSLPSEIIGLTTAAPGSGDEADGQYFSPYVDMSLSSSQELVSMVEEAELEAVTLAFLLSSGADQIGWGGYGTIENDGLPNGSSMLEIVDELHASDVDVTISFGGANGQEPALTFSGAAALTDAYQSVIDRYGVDHLDFDIEGGAIANTSANALRNEALVALQQDNPDLEISFTLPVLPTGLTHDGLGILAQAQADGVEIDVVNIMAMDYGEAVDSGDMGKDAIDAAESTLAQLDTLGIDAQLGITPMIGINDVQSEIFTLEDAQELIDYADGKDDIAYLSMWSLSRDNGGTLGYVSPVGSGLPQEDYAFSDVLSII